MKTSFIYKTVLIVLLLGMGCNSYAQLKFYDNNRLTIGNTTPYSFYYYTFVTTGMYMKCATNNFFQIDVSAAAMGIKLCSTTPKPAHSTTCKSEKYIITRMPWPKPTSSH